MFDILWICVRTGLGMLWGPFGSIWNMGGMIFGLKRKCNAYISQYFNSRYTARWGLICYGMYLGVWEPYVKVVDSDTFPSSKYPEVGEGAESIKTIGYVKSRVTNLE